MGKFALRFFDWRGLKEEGVSPLYTALLIILATMEGYLLFESMVGKALLSKLIYFHSFVTIPILGYSAFRFWIKNKRINVRFVHLLMIAFLSIFGFSLCLGMIVLQLLFPSAPISHKEMVEDLFFEYKAELGKRVYEDIISNRDEVKLYKDAYSFYEIMLVGTEEQKQLVIEKIIRSYQPDFASTLWLAMKDKSHSVRVQAAMALNYLDREWTKRYDRLEDQVALKGRRAIDLFNLAKHCLFLVSTRLLDKFREDEMKEKARLLLEEVLTIRNDDFKVTFLLAKLYLQLNLPSQAIPLIEKCLELQPSRINTLIHLMMKAQYALREYDQVNQLASELKGREGISSQIDFWLSGCGSDVKEGGKDRVIRYS